MLQIPAGRVLKSLRFPGSPLPAPPLPRAGSSETGYLKLFRDSFNRLMVLPRERLYPRHSDQNRVNTHPSTAHLVSLMQNSNATVCGNKGEWLQIQDNGGVSYKAYMGPSSFVTDHSSELRWQPSLHLCLRKTAPEKSSRPRAHPKEHEDHISSTPSDSRRHLIGNSSRQTVSSCKVGACAGLWSRSE